jgi:hypothetical protein
MVDIEKYYTILTNEARLEIDSANEQLILNADLSELITFFCTHRLILPIEVDQDRALSSEILPSIDTRIPSDYKMFQARLKGVGDHGLETLVVEIPIKTNATITKICQLYSYIDEEKSIKLEESTIRIKMLIKEHSTIKKPEDVEAEVNRKKALTYEWIKTIQQTIANLNGHLTSDVKDHLLQRRTQLLATRQRHEEIIKKINIPLKKKEDEVTKNIKLDRTPLVKRIMPSLPAKTEEYVLERRKVLDIIYVLDNQGRQFEKTPYSYKTLGEDDLRNILLVNLNSIFEGRAVGEAFSNLGKADITLNIDKGNILIMECKIWGGISKHFDAVTQLISYLTWRHNYGIVINFCRVKDMSKIIRNTAEEISKHNTFFRNGKISCETHFSTVHKSPSDADKLIEIHHLFYNLFVKD